MKKLSVVFLAILVIIAACKSAPPAPPPGLENPGITPILKVTIPEMFSPSPDIADDKMTISIAVEHPIPIKDWTIQVQPARRQTEQTAQQSGQTAERPARQATQREGQPRQRAPFFEQSGTGNPPTSWQWNGKSTRPSGEMVQSATDYQFTLNVNDFFGNKGTFEGLIQVDVLVRREGNDLRIIVPSIVFPPNASDFSLLSDDDRRANTRVLRLIANSLNKYPDYKITVEGHSNPTTPPKTTQRTNEETRELKPLSEQRAKAVVDYLATNNNIARARLSSVGIGGERTVADYDDDEENWKNRRVEFILKK